MTAILASDRHVTHVHIFAPRSESSLRIDARSLTNRADVRRNLLCVDRQISLRAPPRGETRDVHLTNIGQHCTVFSGRLPMTRTGRKGAEEARNQLPDLLDAAEKGRSTIITKHGRPIAVLVPIDEFVDRSAQRSLLPWKGTGRGLWRKSSPRTLRGLRDEWSR